LKARSIGAPRGVWVWRATLPVAPRATARLTPGAIARLLAKHGLAARPPPHEKPSPPGQLKLRFDA